jgi:hypothetical protein
VGAESKTVFTAEELDVFHEILDYFGLPEAHHRATDVNQVTFLQAPPVGVLESDQLTVADGLLHAGPHRPGDFLRVARYQEIDYDALHG